MGSHRCGEEAARRNRGDGALHIKQNKTKAPLRIDFTGRLSALISRIAARKADYKVRSFALIVDEDGKHLGKDALRYRFDKAWELAGVTFQFRDLRAKAGTDKADASDMRQAQQQLGHKSITTTEIYIRNRKGQRVTPTK